MNTLTLSNNQIETLRYILDGYNFLESNGYDPECREDVDNILDKLAEVN